MIFIFGWYVSIKGPFNIGSFSPLHEPPESQSPPLIRTQPVSDLKFQDYDKMNQKKKILIPEMGGRVTSVKN